MTACVNKKHTRRVALAISASLVGALSLGAAAPAVAFAEDGVSTQSVSEAQAWSNGKLTYAHDNQGLIITGDLNSIEFEVNGPAKYVVPIKVTPEKGKETVVTSDLVTYWFDANSNGVIDSGDTRIAKGDDTAALASHTWAVGSYLMVIEAPAGSEYDDGGTDKLVAGFKVVNKSLDGAKIYDAASGDVSDDEFVYTKNGQSFGFLLDGVTYGETNSIFDVRWYDRNTGNELPSEPVDAGEYTALLVGKTGTDYARSEEQVNFDISKRDLTTAAVSITDLEWKDSQQEIPEWARVDDATYSILTSSPSHQKGSLKATVVGIADGSSVVRNKTTYTVELTPSEFGEKNFTGKATVEFSIVGTLVPTSSIEYFFQGYKTLDNASAVVYTDDQTTHIEGSLIRCTNPNAKLSVVVTDAAGQEVDFDAINSVPGDYTISARVDAKLNSYNYGSDTAVMKVKTRKGEVKADAKLWFTYDGTVVDHVEPVVYDGGDFLKRIGTVVEYGDATLVAGEDYTVTVTDAYGKVVDSIVDAGRYTITVSSSVYDITGAKGSCQLVIDVKPIMLNDVRLGSDDVKTFEGKDAFIPYDGSEHGYYFYYEVKDAKGNVAQVRIPDGVLNLDHFEFINTDGEKSDADAISELGTYFAHVTQAEGVVNYVLADTRTDNFLTVKSSSVFTDVPSTHWGAEGIFDAYRLGYMSGYKGTTFFGPSDTLSRAQAAVVLYNMGTNRSVDETNDAWNTWHEHGLAFPDAEQWYAAELGWASTLDIVSGYPDGNYGGSDDVTREQFAIMLRNYAAAKGEDVSVDDVDAALEGVKDADTISDWAREAVAWAVENGVMGAEGYVYADQSIERAQAALMVTRYQPEQLTGSDLLTNGVRR
ncbi:S-layer homology domain-containing protein [Collinsella sp. An2]|uniref:S-layer homology domain-containing protein n=1 Tax=Collinsella sp. An2 TaxID=1965585 RepID=UPI000B3744ED|nr:S-layer homology domain-containing protein [Collinsella sp. An2]OUP06190.1 hypothetical protein B5F33_10370 [Collinsella sp. An2]